MARRRFVEDPPAAVPPAVAPSAQGGAVGGTTAVGGNLLAENARLRALLEAHGINPDASAPPQ